MSSTTTCGSPVRASAIERTGSSPEAAPGTSARTSAPGRPASSVPDSSIKLTWPETLRQTSMATRVLPIPPAPVIVTSRAPSASSSLTSPISASRPNSRDLADGTPSDLTPQATNVTPSQPHHALTHTYRAIARCNSPSQLAPS